MTNDPRGYLCFVLHAHLPYVREPQHERFLEEGWYYEALTESYLPLLLGMENLRRDGIDFRLTLSLSPPLIAMLEDPLLRGRYEKRLDDLVSLSTSEIERHPRYSPDRGTAQFYRDHFERLRAFYYDECNRDLLGACRRLQEHGVLEVITSAATHGFLPLLRHEPSSVEAQVRVGVDQYTRVFGTPPQGLWLPECGYYPGLEETLERHGILYFFLEAHGVLHGSTRARYGIYAPVVCPNGVAAFGRDPECSRQVWSSKEGFPGHPDYREFYRDIGFDRPLESIGAHIGPDGIRTQTGIKYHRITGEGDAKQPYERGRAMRRAVDHAQQFLKWRQDQVEWLADRMDRRPIVVAPYDAELFGHWWFEGPEWVSFLLRKIAFEQDTVQTITPSEYLAEYPSAQVSEPSLSSWGHKGYCEFWLNPTNDWLYPALHRAAERLSRLAHFHAGAGGVPRRLLNQAGRELLLAQSSDWAFILKSGTAAEFASKRAKESLDNVAVLLEPFGDESDARPNDASETEIGPEVRARLDLLEERHRIFDDLQFEVFAPTTARASYACPQDPKHVAFLSAEAVPYVKVGGLADVAGALPAALAELGVRVTLVLPAYGSIDREKFGAKTLYTDLPVRLGNTTLSAKVLEAESPCTGVRVLFVAQPDLFGRPGVYVDPESGDEYPDTARRFAYFTRAALETLRRLGEPVDVVHSHDHQTALAGCLLKLHYGQDPVLGLAASVYTLHNLGYQGTYGPEVLDYAGLGRDLFQPGTTFEHRGSVNFMKLGIEFADKVNTVSEGYAAEICADPEHLGAGLGAVLQARGSDFIGILNGIDMDVWNPSNDDLLPERYDVEHLSGKEASKRKLFDVTSLEEEFFDYPLVGMITRLVDQKGLDLVEAKLENILESGVNLVVLGTGLPRYEEFLADAAKRFPGRVAVELRYDNAMAHLIEAGADMFLMPSLYEPCGLNQIYSLRYGTVPVVRHTGGLADTVLDVDRANGSGGGVGFSFVPYEGDALLDALERAVNAYGDSDRWKEIVQRGMRRDHSWGASARRYFDLYRGALQCRA